MTSSDVRFGFLGAGGIARNALAPAVHAAPGARLAAVASRDPARAEALGPDRVHAGYEQLLADPDVDVVYVALHNDAHRPWAEAALAAGKHVLCEKPLGLDAAEVRSMQAAAAAADRLLVEAFWYRWHPRTRRLAELLAAGALGPVRQVHAEFSFDADLTGNFRLEAARGGGALYDVGCYAVSAVHAVLGDVPARVTGAAAITGPTGVDLRLRAGLALGDAVAEVACGISGTVRQHLAVVGEAATVEFGPGDAFSNRDAASGLRITTPDGAVRTESFAPVDPYRRMVAAVAAAVRGGEPPLVTPQDSLRVATTLDALRAAAVG